MRSLLLCLCAAVAACSSDKLVASGPPSAADLTGTWSISQPAQPAGTQFSWTLVARGDSASGTGIFAGEAGPFGTMTVHGVAQGDSIHLTVEFVYDHIFSIAPFIGYFNGVLVTHTQMDGLLTRPDGLVQPYHLSKVP